MMPIRIAMNDDDNNTGDDRYIIPVRTPILTPMMVMMVIMIAMMMIIIERTFTTT